MELKKVRQLSDKDLIKEIVRLRNMVVQLRSETAMHKLKNYRSLRTSKRYLAQLLTTQQERKIISQIEK